PFPAIVVMVPSGATLRIRLSPESLIAKLPSCRTATPLGASSRASVAEPQSPHGDAGSGHAAPVPATVEMMPLADTFLTLFPWSSVMRNPPSGVATARSGALSFAEVAGPPSPHGFVGAAHGTPVPATVVMWPSGHTLRIRSFERSAIRNPPSRAGPTPVGWSRCAEAAGPPSPPNE